MNNNSNSKATILECALALFSEKGYESVGVAQIVQEAKITKPTLYYFFGSKEGLFKAILDEYYTRLNTRLQRASVYTPNPQSYFEDVLPVLRNVAQVYFDFVRENPLFYRLVLSLSFSPPTAAVTDMAKPYSTTQYATVTKLFSDIANTHTNLKGSETKLARYFVAAVNSEIGFWLQGAGELDDETINILIEKFMHGIFS